MKDLPFMEGARYKKCNDISNNESGTTKPQRHKASPS
jgi:hypothetical protein